MADLVLEFISIGVGWGFLIGGGAYLMGYGLRSLLRLFSSLSNG